MNAADEVIGRGRERAGDEGIAVVDQDGEWSYRDMEERINQYGNAMLSLGVARENRVLFLLDDSAQLAAAYLAAIRIGAVSIAFNLRASSKDLKYVIEESRAVLLFIESDLLPVYEEIEESLDESPTLIVSGPSGRSDISLGAFTEERSRQLDSRKMSDDDMAFWIYSSGTTGQPKAIVHLHHDVMASDRHLTRNLGIRSGDRLFCTSKIFFAYSLGNVLLGGLRTGATLILNRGWPDAEEAARVVCDKHPDILFTVPTFYKNLIVSDVARDPAFRKLRCCVSAGEALPSCLFEQWREMTGQEIYEGLGSSETIYLVIANSPGACRPGWSGRLQPWVEARLEGESKQIIDAPDTPGMLWIRTDSVCDRYWNRQQLSRKTFVDGWYCTGDVMSFDEEDWWQHHGRLDSMLKISGQWVSPVEIEECALTAENVVEAAVVGKVNEDGLIRATLFVVPAEMPTDEADYRQKLLDHLRADLAVYKCPRNICLLSELPRTDTGKLKRYVLRQWMETCN
jgi:benzoate-CoA ligase